MAFIDANKDAIVDGRRLGVEPICGTLQVAPSTYYAARGRAPSMRERRDQELTPRLVEIWRENYQVYGARKLWKTARRAGIDIGRDQPVDAPGRDPGGAALQAGPHHPPR